MLLQLNVRNVSVFETIFFWTVEPEVNEIVSRYGYILEISESEIGPWTQLYNDPIYAYGYSDKDTQRGMADQRIFYRVKAIDTDKVYFSNIVCLDNKDNNFISDYISENNELYLKRFGHEYIHFSKKKFGERCDICWDNIHRKSIKPKCTSCFGTTYKNGYFAPVKINIAIDPKAKQIDKHEYGVTEANNVSGWTSNKVIIEADDILISLKRPNERYFISNLIPMVVQEATVKQTFLLTQLKQDHPGQLIKLDSTIYTIDEFNIFRREWKTIL